MTDGKTSIDLQNITRCIDGWLTDGEGALLYRLAKGCTGRGVIVEIGSWKGKSTIYLGRGSQEGNRTRIYAIDPHTGYPEQRAVGPVWTFDEFTKNIRAAGVDDCVVPIVLTSAEAAQRFREPVELIFIDGAHEHEFVKKDFELWFPKVIPHGIMVFHDTVLWDGPKRVVEDMVYRSPRFRNVGFIDSTTFAEKVDQNSLRDRFRNRYIFSLRKIYIAAAKAPPPKSLEVIGKRVVQLLQ